MATNGEHFYDQFFCGSWPGVNFLYKLGTGGFVAAVAGIRTFKAGIVADPL
jgi:hypothetical protein